MHCEGFGSTNYNGRCTFSTERSSAMPHTVYLTKKTNAATSKREDNDWPFSSQNHLGIFAPLWKRPPSVQIMTESHAKALLAKKIKLKIAFIYMSCHISPQRSEGEIIIISQRKRRLRRAAVAATRQQCKAAKLPACSFRFDMTSREISCSHPHPP